MPDTAWLVVAALGAGILNTLAGGGTFLTFPALVFTGVPPVAANATSAVAVFPGYLGGALGFKRELQTFDRQSLRRLVGITVAGGLAGSILLLISSNEAFSIVVPFLLLAATLAFLLGDRIRAWAAMHSRAITPFGSAGLFATSIYGGYFNGGLGIVLLALFALWGMTNIHTMNGLKNGLSFALSAISVVTFAAAGIVAWPQATIMMAAATVGGYFGAPIARALPKGVVQGIVAVVGFAMSLIFFLRLVI
ncbi:MAG TPA: sulfite exporter TauE/SafE family protein [Amaricoccus sp.]|uniref:sulfite exporter TauE/SafE family protein n=1 Tax=Amaricoccus sp. TaxID=1872485 RepID=UPI002BAD05F8|nr:sulfite exporter TauE/SafE family protein [Amaricoccus sp.]HMQ91659.1 sulfite exporter TauE/SafE family protein [Amaricoccus sp.]HMR52238.1 sulfite exporter TauE/SafE family protein [Amaricoccus sp.]HMT99090.1 sulfite exporter TauE/SafE family protein [Amaricoccus sp.]